MMEEQANFFNGLKWGVIISIPLWISFFGWIKLFINLA